MAVVYDLETTGLDPTVNHAIQITARLCAVSVYGFDEICCRSWYINPGYQLSQNIIDLTGITDDFLSDKPREYEVAPEIAEFFGNYPVVGYNNKTFDDLFMKVLYDRYGYDWAPKASMDIYTLVKHLFQPNELKNQKLQTVAEYFQVTDQIEHFHNAEADTMATILVANKCIELCKSHEEYKPGPIKCLVTGIRRWENKKNWKMKRLYVDTDVTKFYYDIYTETWNPVYEDDLISQYDMPDIVNQVLKKTGCKNEEELANYK